jgi:hypothetical protein
MAMKHPAQYSPEVIDVLRTLIEPGSYVYDPFAGTGLRLGALCDEIGAVFAGGDIEDWPGHDRRVGLADALDPMSYPMSYPKSGINPIVVTSPVYQNKRLGDYPNGPTPNTKTKGRRDYGIALGRPLHPNNLARVTGRKSKEADYWRLHAAAVKLWPDRVIVNVDLPIMDRWVALLHDAGYLLTDYFPAYTRRDRGVGCAEYEVAIRAER